MIIVSVHEQRLYHRRKTGVWYSYPVSTAASGTGNIEGSLQTPLGKHRIAEKIGDGLPLHTAFKAREPVGIYSLSNHELTYLPWMAHKQKSRTIFADSSDWILTRILWLEGIETGKNRRGRVDTKSRYIYIHGTHDEKSIGTPVSHGCIRMHNLDMLELFEYTHHGELVKIVA
jgi:hypothetical protein